jgi:16S rRNA (cytosine967-C5)-methyltransferase
MENKGQLIAMDLYESKLKQLKLEPNVMVLSILNALLTLQSNKNYEKADRVLIDAPCSGLCFKRNPDAKWKLRPEFIDNIRKVQSEVLKVILKLYQVENWCMHLPDFTF